jgi:hypothetical protein
MGPRRRGWPTLEIIDRERPLASWFLLLTATLFLTVYALPLLLFPLQWARAFGWSTPEQVALTDYFGRCLGAVATAITLLVLRAVPDPRRSPVLFDLIFLAGVLLAVVHVWGTLGRRWPVSEKLEILLYAGVAALAAYVRSRLRPRGA